MFVKRYNLIIATQAPLFIGSGKQYGTRDYIYFENDSEQDNAKSCYFYAPEQLYKLFEQSNLNKDFEAYMLDNREHQNIGVLEWLQQLQTDADDASRPRVEPLGGGIGDRNAALLQGFLAQMGDGSDAGNDEADCPTPARDKSIVSIIDELKEHKVGGYVMPYSGENKPLAIEAFVKDGRERFYLPASSVKGALRTQIERILRAKGRMSNQDEFSFYNKLSLADSGILGNKHFCIIEKLGKMRNGTQTMSTYRECLLPKRTVRLSLITKSQEMDELVRAVVNQETLTIGGGAGFSTKCHDTQAAARAIFDNNPPTQITPSAVRYNGTRYEMGKCAIRLEEVQ